MRWRDDSPAADLPVWPAARPLTSLTALPGPGGSAAPEPWLAVGDTVLSAVLAHLSGQRHERGGLLLGTAHALAYTDAARPGRILILAAVPATAGEASRIALRMDSTVWQSASAALTDLQRHEPEARIVGWYHSHPGLGAFFSETDRKTQRAFFSHPYSVGWVVDPFANEHAAFVGAESVPVRLGLAAAPDAPICRSPA